MHFVHCTNFLLYYCFIVFTVEYFSFVFLFATLIYYTQTENYFEPKKQVVVSNNIGGLLYQAQLSKPCGTCSLEKASKLDKKCGKSSQFQQLEKHLKFPKFSAIFLFIVAHSITTTTAAECAVEHNVQREENGF